MKHCLLLITITLLFLNKTLDAQKTIGIFEGETDIGNVSKKGSALYDAETQQYTVEGSGTNMWFEHDAFHFVWRKMKGNFILRANVAFSGKGVEAHRKMGLIIRTSLDSTASHANVVVHGDGLTSLQYRKTTGATTDELKSSLTGADVIQLERRGNTYIMSVANKGEPFVTEKLDELNLGDEVYAGIFVCSHNNDVLEKAVFSNVRIVVPAGEKLVPYKEYLGSNIEILDVQGGNSTVIYQSPKSLQAPNWTTDGKSLIYNSEGLLYNFDLATKKPSVLNTGSANKNNNDHVISFEGKMIGISSNHSTADSNVSIVYTLPITGGEPKRITQKGPSYLHGWSPDGKFLVYTGQRNKEFDIYKTPSAGGEEVRLTTAPGLDDGSEYTPDGNYIYFNSVRTGKMQIWRMKPDGTEQKQITNDDFNNWFPHVSPDGKWIVYMAFYTSDVKPDDHPFYKHVYLCLMPASGGKPKIIAYLYGGQGTINTPSWSPDSKKIAFVSNTNLLFDNFSRE